ncbi:hypothetical protein KR067_003440 [Drosophila pandora]|nr:hypothetical protein KR067_003440 [Drosophila pandora]
MSSDHQDVICMPMEPLTTDYGVCFDTELEPYLRYMDAVLLQASRTPAILGLDANAASPMWFSKPPRNPEGHANYNRGELLSEWMLENGAVALNQPSPVFTFDTYRARSDIDVTIANDAASMWATFEWRVDEWELSDHNMITVVVTPTTTRAVESLAPVPSWNISNARWQLFEQEMMSRAADIPEDFSQSPLDQQVSTLRCMVHDACDLAMGRRTPRSPRRRKPVAESDAPIAGAEEVPPALEEVEVDACVARLKSGRSPGLDGINGTICKAVWRAIPQYLTALYSRCIQSGYFPRD